LYLWKNQVPVCFWKGIKMAKTGWFWSFLKHSRTGGFHERINDSMIGYFFFSINLRIMVVSQNRFYGFGGGGGGY